MADSGYGGVLITIGNWNFPVKYIKADSYKAYLNMQDLDPWTDADGYLHRNAVDLKAFKVEFETIPMLTGKQLDEIITNIQTNYTNIAGRIFNCTAYIPENNDWVTQKAYLADFQPQIYGIFNDIIYYDSVRFAIIGGLA